MNKQMKKLKTRTDELGNTFALIKDLIPSELNKQIYGSESKENSKVDEIALDMKKRIAKGLTPNTVPIPVHMNGKMKGGHTRLKAAEKAGVEKVQVNVLSELESQEINDNSYAEVLSLLSDNTMSRDKDHEVILQEYNALEMAYVEQYDQQPTKLDCQEWVKKIQSGTTHPISVAMMSQLKVIKSRDPSLFEKIKTGKMSPKQAYTSVKNFKPKNKPRKNRKILEVFEDKENTKLFLNLFKQGVNKFLDKNTLTLPNGKVINWVTDKNCGVESVLARNFGWPRAE